MNEKQIVEKIRVIKKVLPDLRKSLEKCDLCPRKCGVNRVKGELGYCKSGADPVVYSATVHHGEEPPISGDKGSGTIFFSRCNMRCLYCQNYRFSQDGQGKLLTTDALSQVMLNLQKKGVHNINLVSPTHFVPCIIKALDKAYAAGLRLPVVYNTGGYDSLEIIKKLSGIIDIYLPDMRYSSDDEARKYSDAIRYVENNQKIVKEMYSQVGRLEITQYVAEKGLVIRLLVIPNDISGTIKTLEFIAKNISKEIFLSVMSQYYPAYKAGDFFGLSGRLKKDEYERIVCAVHKLGFKNGWIQPFEGEFDEKFAGENFVPNV
ncbi:MAG: radical SAM protein [Candidatus Omnitrophica bacterium]|nr:radical SAM protein [Candidatus Omnitrophota bacterium]